MKRCLAILCVVALALPLASCRKSDTPQPVGADNAVGPSVIVANPNPSLGESQVTLSSKAEAARTSAGMATPTTTAPTTPEATTPAPAASTVPAESVTAIKAVIDQMKAAAAANPNELPVQFMADDIAPAAKAAQQSIKDLPAKMEALKAALAAKSIPVPENLEKGIGNIKMSDLSIGLLKAAPESLKFELSGDKVIVTSPTGDKEAFVNTPAGWKLTAASADDAKKFADSAEIPAANAKLLDAMIASVNDGSITKDNFSAKQDELFKQIVQPVLEKGMTPKAPTAPATETPAAPAAPAAPATETPAAPATPAASAPAAAAADVPKADEKKPVDAKGALKAITNPGGE